MIENEPNQHQSRRVTLDCLTNALSLWQRDFGMLLLGMLVLIVIGSVAGSIPSLFFQAAWIDEIRANKNTDIFSFFVSPAYRLQTVIGEAISSFMMPLYATYTFSCLQALRGQKFRIEQVFDFRGQYWPLVFFFFVLNMLLYIPFLVITSIPAFVIYAVALACFSPLFHAGQLLVLERKMDAWPAIFLNLRVAGPKFLSIFGVSLLAGLVSALGLLLCCIGIILTLPIYYITLAGIYRQLYGDLESPFAQSAPSAWNEPPRPGAPPPRS